MTKLPEEAFAKASKLPEVKQNGLARWILVKLGEERKSDKTSFKDILMAGPDLSALDLERSTDLSREIDL
ncbi:MAG: hypothetical protein Q7O66_01330 [Dehalococcoidia bacterium]|nr:hypothetical protein [Dehalococcoidia bacterium]